jgi:FKBP-type peptidyl-prolyl cis-trans isomerase (trigger factor)
MDDYLRSASKTEEELREELRPSAEEQVTRFLVLRQLAKEEDLAVEDTDIDSEVDSISGGQSESAENLRQALASESARASVASVILSRKVLERLSEIVQSDDPPEAAQPANDEAEDEAPSQSAEEADQAETEDQEGEGASDKQPA